MVLEPKIFMEMLVEASDLTSQEEIMAYIQEEAQKDIDYVSKGWMS